MSGLAVPSPDESPSKESLGRWPATSLFLQRAEVANPDLEWTPAEAAATIELCRYLAGLPLALELAAARAPVLPPTEILDRVRDSLRVLGPGRRDAPERHRTMQAAIDWSVSLLASFERTLFARLSLFVGGFTVEAAEAVCVDLDGQVLDGLSTLLDHGLLQRRASRERARLWMLEPIRDYAVECLRRGGDYRRVLVARAAYYTALAGYALEQLKKGDHLRCFGHLDDERSNLLAVLHTAESQPEIDMALQIANALTDYWYHSDLVPEIREWLQWAVQQPAGSPAMRAQALFALGIAACEDGEYETATRALEQCLSTCTELADVSLAAKGEAQLAFCAASQRRHPEASAHAARATQLVAQLDDPWTEAIVLMLCGSASRNLDEARRQLERALRLFDSLGGTIWATQIHINLGYIAMVHGEYPLARDALDRALIQVDIDATASTGMTAQVQGHLGLLNLLEGRHRDAFELLRRALISFRETGDRKSAREMQTGVAAVAAICGYPQQAANLAAHASSLYDGPRSELEDILHEHYLNNLGRRRDPTTSAQPPTTEEKLEAVLDALIDDHL